MAYREQTFLSSSARTASGNSSSFDFSDQKTFEIFLVSSAGTGTLPTLDVAVECSADGTNWVNYGDFGQVTGSGASTQIMSVSEFGKYLRIAYVIAGTTPSFTFSVIGIGR